MTTGLHSDDPRIDRLTPAHAAALRAVIAAPNFDARTALATPLLHALGLQPLAPGRYILRPVGEPRAWDAPSRWLLALLAETEIDLARYPVYSVPSWLRCWLGLEPTTALFVTSSGELRLEALRRVQDDRDAFDALISSFPAAERVEILVELLEGGRDFKASTAERALGPAMEALDASAGPWARTQADALRADAPIGRRAIVKERAIFLALVRAGIPIEPRWDPFVPLAHGAYAASAMQASLAAIPEARRASAALARLERCDPHFDRPVLTALEVLARVPDPAIARWVLQRRDDHAKPKEIVERLRTLAREHSSLLAVLEEPEPTPRFVVQALPISPLDELGARQLEIASERYDGKRRSAAAILEGDDDDEAIVPRTVARFVLLEEQRSAFDLWTYMGDAGTIFAASSTEVIAEVVQGGVECRDADLRRALRIALAAAKDLQRGSRATTASPKTKKPAKTKANAPAKTKASPTKASPTAKKR